VMYDELAVTVVTSDKVCGFRKSRDGNGPCALPSLFKPPYLRFPPPLPCCLKCRYPLIAPFVVFYYLYVLCDLAPKGEFQNKVEGSCEKTENCGKVKLHFTDVD
jgi:hypothetical protein